MKVRVLYKPNSEHDSQVQGYVREFEARTGKQLMLLDIESVEGVDLAKIHDIMQSPAILVTEEDGSFVQMWLEMDKWPTISELSFYTQ